MATHAPSRRWFAAAMLALAAALFTAAAVPRTSGIQPDVSVADLPLEARDVNMLIRKGGPFAFERDGVVFGNRERILPPEPRGYYHEYTVRTPGVSSRGARRIICGGPTRQPDACWYTSDHYQTFQRIRE